MSADTRTQTVTSHWIALCAVLFSIGLLAAVVLSAPLTWDGAFYFLYLLETREPLIAQGRIADLYLQYPAAWMLQITDSPEATLFTFSFIHVITPLISLGLSWWVIRHDHSHLIIWPMLAMGLALLPGQINFISEAIKAEQLMWPLLLAIVIGAPQHTLPVIAVLAFSIFHLHPVAAPILAACGLAGIAIGLLRTEYQRRLLVIGAVLLLAGIYKYTGTTDSHAQQEMSRFTQQRQWENGTQGLPTIAVFATWCIAMGLLVQPFLNVTLSKVMRWLQLFAISMGTLALIIWSAYPSRWWQALEFRGPAFWITMFLTGCMFLHSVILHFRPDRVEGGHQWHVITLAAGFCAVMVVQSIAWNGVVSDFRHQLAASSTSCLVREELPGYPLTPLNLWSTNAFSLLDQGYTPTRISMTAEECHIAKESGVVETGSHHTNNPVRFDYAELRQGLTGGTMCTWEYIDGWYQQEGWIYDKWRWMEQSGTLLITLPEAGQVNLAGFIRTLHSPNTIDIVVNGEIYQGVSIESGDEVSLETLTFDLPAGESRITFRSHNLPDTHPDDDRLVTISLWNPVMHPSDGSTRCLGINAT